MFRNFLGTQATALAWLPSPPPAASDQEGEQQIANKLLVLGANRQVDSENAALIPAGSQQSINLLSVVNLVVTTDSQPDYGSKTKTSAVPEFLASFVHPGRVSTVQVTGAQQAVHVVTGSADGNVAFLRLSIPLSPGSSIDDIDVLEDTPGSPLQSVKLYTSRVSAAQVSPDGNQLLTASTDGALHVSDFPLTLHGEAGKLTPFFDSQQHQTFTCAGWATDWVFVTAGTRGPLQCWDVRKGGRPASRSPFDHFEVAGAFARPVSVGDRCASCLSLHPSRPHLCAIGCGQGVALVWDLRFQKMPVACTASAGGTSGQVSCVAFDPMAPEAASVLLFSCRGHPLAASKLSELVNVAEPLVKGSAGGAGSMQCFDVEPTTGDDIIGLADEECLVFIPRQAPQGRML